MNPIKKFSRLERDIKEAEKQNNKNIGALEQVIKEFKEKFGVETIEEVEQHLKKIDKETEEVDQQIEKEMQELEKLWGDKI